SIPSDSKHTVHWCLESLPTLYVKFCQTSESRYGHEITRLVQAVLKELLQRKPISPEAQQLTASIANGCCGLQGSQPASAELVMGLSRLGCGSLRWQGRLRRRLPLTVQVARKSVNSSSAKHSTIGHVGAQLAHSWRHSPGITFMIRFPGHRAR